MTAPTNSELLEALQGLVAAVESADNPSDQGLSQYADPVERARQLISEYKEAGQ